MSEPAHRRAVKVTIVVVETDDLRLRKQMGKHPGGFQPSQWVWPGNGGCHGRRRGRRNGGDHGLQRRTEGERGRRPDRVRRWRTRGWRFYRTLEWVRTRR